MNSFPIKPAIDYGGKVPNGEQRAAARRCGHSELPRHHSKITHDSERRHRRLIRYAERAGCSRF
jgi:hypothetical protein